MSKAIIKSNRTIIPACDVDFDIYEKILDETSDLDEIGGYKVGFFLALKHGLPKIIDTARKYTDKPIIYDHQKAGTDVPHTGKLFARACRESGVDAVIFYPLSGPKAGEAYIKSALDEGLGVIVGGKMSHEGFSSIDGGYIEDEAVFEIYKNAAEYGVRDFGVPGNTPDHITKIKKTLESIPISPTLYIIGIGQQGGVISEDSKVAGKRYHFIVGRNIYEQKIRRNAEELIRKLRL